MTDQFPSTKAVATVRDVARMVSLSPARFYQLQQSGIFPWPLYDIITRRPHYTEEQQLECLEVRRRNCGINGKPILFYARRLGSPLPTARPKSKQKKSGGESHSDLVADLKALGLQSVTTAQVESAMNELFPTGVVGVEQGDVIRAVFCRLKASEPKR
jgi:hypothetical protein